MCWCTPGIRTPFCGAPGCNRTDAEEREACKVGADTLRMALDAAIARAEKAERERDEAQRWRERWCREAEAYGLQSQANWKRARNAEEALEALRADLARISEEMDLPPTIGPAPGEIRKLRLAAIAAARGDQ